MTKNNYKLLKYLHENRPSCRCDMPEMKINHLYLGDCLDVMSTFPDKCFDLIVADPPYNVKIAEWDNIKGYYKWCAQWILECQRILKDNSSMYFFHSEMESIARLMEWIRQNTRFIFNSFIVWHKPNFRNILFSNPGENNTLRCWFNICEYILYYTFRDQTGLTTVILDTNNFPTLRQYFKDFQEALGMSQAQIEAIIGSQKAEHAFRWGSTQWDMPTRETYKLLEALPFKKDFVRREYEDLRREYEDLRREYEDLRREYEDLRYTHNLDSNHSNIWKHNTVNNGYGHPTQKPMELIERIMKVSSNEGGIVLDLFSGSGTTAITAINMGRRWVGIEKDEGYYTAALKRIANRKAQPTFFEEINA